MRSVLALIIALWLPLGAVGQQGFSEAPDGPSYVYTACVDTLADVYDADTIMRAKIDLGFRVWVSQDLRLVGIDAPEMRGPERPEGIVSRDWLREQVRAANGCFLVRTYDTGKYGRWLAEVFIDGRNLNSEMVALGLAEIY